MYIKSIVLDGFKSYRTRTEINGFDSTFNAITGLNGSGKSNILDSICFVLGISNLSQVRAGQLQDLVFKNGQAGITKATVSITFDNRDKSQCPPGYEEFQEIIVARQVIIGGKNKYTINGLNVQHKRVQDLFCSVQLNVNNPNFLIMQGRITKVLNMKPPEILSMIEEAAGSHMYEVKKQEAKRAIEKKDAKLASLVNMMENDIRPKLEKLKDERQQFLEYQRLTRELEHMRRLVTVWQLVKLKKDRSNSDKNLAELKSTIDAKNQTVDGNTEKISEIDKKIEEINAIIDQENGGELKNLEEELKEVEKAENKISSLHKSAKDNLTAAEKKYKQIEKSFNCDEKTLKSKEIELNKFQDMFTQLKETQASDDAALKLAEKRLEAASAGMILGEDGKAATIQAQLMAYQQESSETSMFIQKTEMELKYSLNQLKEKESEIRGNASDFTQDKETLANLERGIKKFEKEIASLNYNEQRANFCNERRNQLLQNIRQARHSVENFENQHPRAALRYKDPIPNFDRKRVHGLVCMLFQVKNTAYCTALEIAAGGRLYNAVVDNEQTSKLILERGQLLQRTTIIPLNKIESQVISDHVLRTAQDLVGSDNVQTALSLISYDKKVEPAMQFVFGNMLVCKDMKTATKVAFDKRIMKRCVTLDGDTVDPAGVLSGGARGPAGTLLVALYGLKDTMKVLAESENELANIEKEIASTANKTEQYNNLKQQLNAAKHEFEVVSQRLQQTDHYRKKAEVDELKVNIENMRKQIEEAKQNNKECQKKINEIQAQIKDVKGHREKLLKETEKEVERLKQKAAKSKKEWSAKEGQYESLNLEISELKKSIESAQEQIAEITKEIEQAKENYNKCKEDLDEAQAKTTEVKSRIKTKKCEIEDQTSEIQKLLTLKRKLNEQSEEIKLEIHRLTFDLENLQKEVQEWQTKEAALLKNKDNKWLASDNRYCDEFESLSEKEKTELPAHFKKLNDKHQFLSRRVNTEAMSLLETEESNYKHLLKRKQTIENDKKSIINAIEKLDKKKEKAVVTAWQEVNKNFGSIFGTLLPGSDAKLQPPEGQSVLNGLEVKVSLGGIWKESLSELSGGQRSLIALSLILSMLLFKPAPIYILDEVDAALDLSHTQNIGNMLRTHFKRSQFIIVSLKDGMFNNANVLFRTQFCDGISTVSRTAHRA